MVQYFYKMFSDSDRKAFTPAMTVAVGSIRLYIYIPIRSATYAQRTDTQSVRCVSIAL
ncbi:MAG: hypothetical protein SOV38_08125 [Prevotella sp.]|nr:hypothetical protein [Prevotella sp.]